MSKLGWVIAIVVVILLIIGAIALVRSGATDPYPTTREGWNARLDAHLAEFGATRGENWDLWLDVSTELERMLENPDSVTDEQLAATLDRLRGVERFTPHYEQFPLPGIVDAYVDHTSIIRSTLRDLVLPRLRSAIEKRDAMSAARWIEHANHVRRPIEQAALIGGLVDVAYVSLLIDNTIIQISTSAFSDADELARMQDAVHGIPSLDHARAFAFEREWSLPLVAEAARAGWPVQARSQIREFDQLMTDAMSIADDPSAIARIEAYQTKLASKPAFAKRRTTLDLMLPSIDRAWAVFQSIPTSRNGTTLLIALVRHRAIHGHYPVTLDDLDPAILSPLPEDPFAPDKRFVYRVLDATAERPVDAILLYSIGADGQDNGGHHDSKSKPLMLGGSGDFVFTRPPEPESPLADEYSEDAESAPEDQP